MRGVVIRAHGLGDPGGDLIVEGLCERCSAVVYTRRYTFEKCKSMSDGEIDAMTKGDVKRDQAAIERHRCRAK
jgi:hypothetical protein